MLSPTEIFYELTVGMLARSEPRELLWHAIIIPETRLTRTEHVLQPKNLWDDESRTSLSLYLDFGESKSVPHMCQLRHRDTKDGVSAPIHPQGDCGRVVAVVGSIVV